MLAVERVRLFDKQETAFKSNKPIIIYVGGIQCGKTTTGAFKMLQAIRKFRDPDDTFIVAAPNYKTLSQATLPKFLKLSSPWGEYGHVKAEFNVRDGGTVYVRTSTDPESLEGITNCRFVWLDEAGQMSKYFFENAMGRAAFKQAQVMLTTTPYAMNWFAELVRSTKEGLRPDIEVVQLRSIDSPYFPRQEYERQKALLDPRRFKWKYMGEIGTMEGLVFDCVQYRKAHKLPTGTRYYAGIDWGYYPDPFALVIRALTPDGVHHRIAEYYKNYLTISDISRICLQRMQIWDIQLFVCDPSQPGLIEELCRAGVPAVGGFNDIRVGIDKMYELMKTDKFFIWEEECPRGKGEYQMYHYREERERGIDEDSREKDQLPVDSDNHGIDADRYVTMELERTALKRKPVMPGYGDPMPKDNAKRIAWLKRGGYGKYRR